VAALSSLDGGVPEVQEFGRAVFRHLRQHLPLPPLGLPHLLLTLHDQGYNHSTHAFKRSASVSNSTLR